MPWLQCTMFKHIHVHVPWLHHVMFNPFVLMPFRYSTYISDPCVVVSVLLCLCTCAYFSPFSIFLQNPHIIQAYLGPFVDIVENQSLPIMERVMTVAMESEEPTKFLVTKGPGLGPCILSCAGSFFRKKCQGGQIGTS